MYLRLPTCHCSSLSHDLPRSRGTPRPNRTPAIHWRGDRRPGNVCATDALVSERRAVSVALRFELRHRDRHRKGPDDLSGIAPSETSASVKATGTKALLRGLTPPFVVSGTRAIRRRVGARTSPLRQWEYVPEGWSRVRADPAAAGWDVAEVVEAYRATLSRFRDAVKGPGPLADPTSPGLRGGRLSIDDQNANLVFGY